MSQYKEKDEMVVVHTIEGKLSDENKFPLKDIRSNKPLGIVNEEENQIVFFQKLIRTRINTINFSIAAPNEISISLSIFKKSFNKAKSIKKELLNTLESEKKTLFNENVIKAYDYIEEIQKAIVFVYKAIESFCNATIPDSYIYKQKDSKGIIKHYQKEQIERWINTSEKILNILPDILDIDCPNDELFWSDFKNLERIRNDIVHSKTYNCSDIISELFSDKIYDYLSSCIDLLQYYIKDDPENDVFPFGFGESRIKIINVEDPSNTFEII